MNQYKSSIQLKNLAKDKLMGKYGPAILAYFLLQLITNALSWFSNLMLPATIAGNILSTILSLVISIVGGVLSIGFTLFFLNMACGQPFVTSDLFYGFREQPNKCLILSLVFALINTLCLLPYQIFSIMFLRTNNVTWGILTMVTMAIGLLVYVPLTLAISQAYFLVLDFPNYSAGETLKKSISIMKGHKARLFYLQVSFLPLMILCLFTCCIGFLWLMPYMQMTMTLFFLDLMNPAKKD